MFYRLFVTTAILVFLINGLSKNASGNSTPVSDGSNGLSHHPSWFAALSSPRTMPEPASLLLIGTGLAVIGTRMRRRAKKA